MQIQSQSRESQNKCSSNSLSSVLVHITHLYVQMKISEKGYEVNVLELIFRAYMQNNLEVHCKTYINIHLKRNGKKRIFGGKTLRIFPHLETTQTWKENKSKHDECPSCLENIYQNRCNHHHHNSDSRIAVAT